MNRNLLGLLCLVVFSLAAFTSLGFAQIELHALNFADDRTIEFQMIPTSRVPGATMKAKVKFEAGQSRIELDYDNMKPAVLFGGEITSYVLWAVNRDGRAENLGELWVRPGKDDETVRFSTGQRYFALIVTGEPYYEVDGPANFLIFRNDSTAKPPIRGSGFTFSALKAAPNYGVNSLDTVAYDSKRPLELVQAEGGHAAAKAMGAETYAPEMFREASISLEQARIAFQRTGASGAVGFARRSYASANDAIRLTRGKKMLATLEAEVAARQKEMDELNARVAASEAQVKAAEDQVKAAQVQIERVEREKSLAEESVQRAQVELQRIAAEKDQLDRSLANLRAERAELTQAVASLERDKRDLQTERTQLQGRLESALSKVADTRESARGFIVNLPDILFDVGQANLKPPAIRALSKLAGILLILEDFNLRIEGHTDSTGSPSFNQRLSQQRADAVFDLLVEEGISASRITTRGYGFERPIASNSTTEGRQQNRRVEIIIAEGVVAEE